jgi:predicted transposase YdaD
MPGLREMRDSATYQAILEEGRAEGRAEEARRLLVLLGTPRFGPPDAATRTRLDAIPDSDTLERLATRLLSASSWANLLSGP